MPVHQQRVPLQDSLRHGLERHLQVLAGHEGWRLDPSHDGLVSGKRGLQREEAPCGTPLKALEELVCGVQQRWQQDRAQAECEPVRVLPLEVNVSNEDVRGEVDVVQRSPQDNGGNLAGGLDVRPSRDDPRIAVRQQQDLDLLRGRVSHHPRLHCVVERPLSSLVLAVYVSPLREQNLAGLPVPFPHAHHQWGPAVLHVELRVELVDVRPALHKALANLLVPVRDAPLQGASMPVRPHLPPRRGAELDQLPGDVHLVVPGCHLQGGEPRVEAEVRVRAGLKQAHTLVQVPGLHRVVKRGAAAAIPSVHSAAPLDEEVGN